MCVVTMRVEGRTVQPLVHANWCDCDCPLGLIITGCDHLRNYPESAWGITQVTPEE